MNRNLLHSRREHFKVPAVLTVVNMHGLSLTAPQHPQNAVTKTMAPMMMDKIGATPKLAGRASVASL